uniref:UV radiation resistance-associated gene protein n=1 Tax=Panagrellus redivivus TaxID=6233 RepID=A0A7E4W283_PANRE
MSDKPSNPTGTTSTADQTDKKQSFTDRDRAKLTSLWSSIQRSQNQLEAKKNELRASMASEETHRSNSAPIQNQQIRLDLYRKRIEQAKMRVRTAQMRLNAAEQEVKERAQEEAEFLAEGTSLAEQAEQQLAVRKADELAATKIKNEIIYRRRFMLFELHSIYFEDHSSARIRDRTCGCTKFDVIRGLHLPSCSERAGHNEVELTAAIGHVVNLLNVIGRILDYHYLYPMFFKGSKSYLLDPNSHVIYNLFDVFTRSHRERFQTAYLSLNRNITQLRTDLGLNNTDLDRPVHNIQNALLCCIGKASSPTANILPSNLFECPASVVPKFGTPNSIQSSSTSQKQSIKTQPPSEDNILDVISAKNETFDVRRLVSRSVT